VVVHVTGAGARSGGRAGGHGGGPRQGDGPRPRSQRPRPVRLLAADRGAARSRVRHQAGLGQDLRQGGRARPRTVRGQRTFLLDLLKPNFHGGGEKS